MRSGSCEGIRRVDAHDLDVGDRPQLLEEVLDPPVREHEGIAAREGDVPDLGVLPDVGERRVELAERDLLGIAHLAAPRAEAAVGGAHRADQEEDAIGIAVGDVRHRGVGVLAERVDDPVHHLVLLGRRDVLPPERVARLLDELEHVGRDAEVEPVDRPLHGFPVDVLDPEALDELVDRGDRLAETLLPVGHVDLVRCGSRRPMASARRWVYGMPSAGRRASGGRRRRTPESAQRRRRCRVQGVLDDPGDEVDVAPPGGGRLARQSRARTRDPGSGSRRRRTSCPGRRRGRRCGRIPRRPRRPRRARPAGSAAGDRRPARGRGTGARSPAPPGSRSAHLAAYVTSGGQVPGQGC